MFGSSQCGAKEYLLYSVTSNKEAEFSPHLEAMTKVRHVPYEIPPTYPPSSHASHTRGSIHSHHISPVNDRIGTWVRASPTAQLAHSVQAG